MIHKLADVQTQNIGENTSIWQFCVVLKGASIGSNCNINAQVFIENDVIIGNNVTIKCGVQIWDGITLEDNVFVGPNVTFTNDLVPRSRSTDWKLKKTIIGKGASLGANATILAGLGIGCYSLVGAGAVVTHDVPDHAVVMGNPAKQKGWVSRRGVLLNMEYCDKAGVLHQLED